MREMRDFIMYTNTGGEVTDTSLPASGDSAEPAAPQPANTVSPRKSPSLAVSSVTLESYNHFDGDIERGVEIYYEGGVEYSEHEPGWYWARVPHPGGSKTVSLSFTRDGQDIDQYRCSCTSSDHSPPVCRHIVAAVLAIQGGIVESKLTLGKTVAVSAAVTESHTAKAVGSGDIDVFATPMMIALMERAACECLSGCLDEGQTSVGNMVNVEHIKPSPVGAGITATAAIEYVFGRRVEFIVTASDGSGEIGRGRHVRTIVDAGRFMKNIRS